jgi:nitrite reductase (NADH) large subunit
VTAPVIVVGTGPVGIRFVTELLKANPLQSIIIFGNEPWQPYNRVKLSSLLAHDLSWENIANQEWLKIKEHPNVTHHLNLPINQIFPEEKSVVDKNNQKHFYEKLVLALGSRPFLPNIKGIEQRGVYTFRDLNDVQALLARNVATRHVCVLGGGLLGLETAKALCRHNTQVTIIQRADNLMNNQLGSKAAERLKAHIEAEYNITIRCKEAVLAIEEGEERATGVVLRSGEIIKCDTIVISTGITPNKELALQAGLFINRGIKVDDKLMSSAMDIYAIGECAEHNKKTYGIVAPGFEQAAIVANQIGKEDSNALYKGSTTAAELKVIGEQVFSVGEIEKPNSVLATEYSYETEASYRKIIVHKGKIIGAHSVGEWNETKRVLEQVNTQKQIRIWQLWRFKSTGQLFSDSENSVASWPNDTIICQCMSVSKGTLTKAIDSGCSNFKALSENTGASSVCGTCKPLVYELLSHNEPVEIEPVSKWKTLIQISFFTFLFSFIFLLLPGITYSLSVQTDQLDQLWIDSDFKQISGFSLLALSLLITLLSLRKRMNSFTWLSYPTWRVIHGALGIVLLMVLITHTGLHLGENLNFALMISYITASLVGSLAGIAISLEHKIKPSITPIIRKFSFWGHLVASWPIPTLLTFHILSVYYF